MNKCIRNMSKVTGFSIQCTLQWCFIIIILSVTYNFFSEYWNCFLMDLMHGNPLHATQEKTCSVKLRSGLHSELGMGDILHAIWMRISSVKPVPWLALNLHHLFSNGAAFNTQSRKSLTSYAISCSYRRWYISRYMRSLSVNYGSVY